MLLAVEFTIKKKMAISKRFAQRFVLCLGCFWVLSNRFRNSQSAWKRWYTIFHFRIYQL